MMNWIHNPHAGFVLVSYAIGFAALVGMTVVALCDYRRRAKEWRGLSQRDMRDDP